MAKANEETVLAVKLALVEYQHQHYAKTGSQCERCSRQVGSLKNEIQIADDAATLKSMARSLHRLYEKNCNEPLTDADHRRIERLQPAVFDLAAQYGITTVSFKSDPRGYAVKLHFPDGRGNTWGGDSEGWGI